MRTLLVALLVVGAASCKKGEETAPAGSAEPEAAAKPEEVIAQQLGEVTTILQEHKKSPKEGLTKLRDYAREHLPGLASAVARALVDLDKAEGKRKARAKEMLKSLAEPLKALQAAAEPFGKATASDEDARELLSDLAESYGELFESLEEPLEALGLDPAKAKCKRAYKVMSKCMEGFEMNEEAFLRECAEHADDAESEEVFACCEVKECDAFNACVKKAGEGKAEAARAQRVKDGIEKLTKQLADKAWRDARWTCDGLKADLKDGSQEKMVCDGVPRQALAAYTTELTALRDKGEEDSSFKCFELKDAAKAVSEDEAKKAGVLCDEVAGAARATAAIAAARKNVQESLANIPFDCDLALDELEKIGSDFAKRKAKDVATACYSDLGKLVLSAKVPTMQYVCDYAVQKVWDAARKWSLQEGDLTAWLEKAKPLCDKSAAPVDPNAPVPPPDPNAPVPPPIAAGELDCPKLCQKQIDCAKSMGGMSDETAKQALEGCSLGCGMAAKSEEPTLRKVYQGMAACMDKACGLEWAQCLGEHMK